MLHYLLCILQLLLSPEKGWEDIAAADRDPRRLLSRGFVPFVVIVSACCFIRLLYPVHNSLTITIISAIVTFVRFYASYFIALFFIPLWFTDLLGDSMDEMRVNTYIIYTLSLLALVALINILLPIKVGLALFMPLYVAIIMWKGAKYLGVPAKRTGWMMVLMVVFIMLPPYLLEWLLDVIS